MTLLVPYVTGGITADWTDIVRAYADHGADAIEIGLPFSDPMLDGVTIQEASDRALARGATAESILAAVPDVGVPLLVMTYANLALRPGFADLLADISGLIVPDLPLDEVDLLDPGDADLILLAAPSTSDERLAAICARSRRFVYAISVMGTTGERTTLASSAPVLAARIRALTSTPVLIGFGISTPAQAAAAGRAGDGVVVASALMRRVLDGATPHGVGQDVAALRAALDQGASAGTAHPEISGDRG